MQGQGKLRKRERLEKKINEALRQGKSTVKLDLKLQRLNNKISREKKESKARGMNLIA